MKKKRNCSSVAQDYCYSLLFVFQKTNLYSVIANRFTRFSFCFDIVDRTCKCSFERWLNYRKDQPVFAGRLGKLQVKRNGFAVSGYKFIIGNRYGGFPCWEVFLCFKKCVVNKQSCACGNRVVAVVHKIQSNIQSIARFSFTSFVSPEKF